MVIGWRGGATCNCGREQSEQQIPGVDGRICTASRTIPLISRDVLLTSSWFPTDMFVTEDRWLWESMSIDFGLDGCEAGTSGASRHSWPVAGGGHDLVTVKLKERHRSGTGRKLARINFQKGEKHYWFGS